MAISNRISSSYRSLLVLVIALFLGGVSVVKAQRPTPSVTATPSPTATVSPSPSPSPTATPSPTASPSPDARAKLLDTTWYPLVISLLFGALVIGFAGTIARVILRSKSSFRSPLGLPEGSLRAMLAFMLVAFLGFYVYAHALGSNFELPQALLGIIATVLGFYFGSRAVEGAGAGAKPDQVGIVDGSVLDNSGAPAGGATVDLSQAGAKKFTKTADTSGKFKFDNVPIGDYEIQASKSGHNPSDSAKVKVTTGKPQTVTLKLK